MNFKDTYKRAAYLDFFRDTLLPEDFDIADESIQLGFQTDKTKKVVKIGEVPSLDLPIFEIKHKSENDPRVSKCFIFNCTNHFGITLRQCIEFLQDIK